MSTQAAARARSLYRSMLRELPRRPLAEQPSAVQQRIRAGFSSSAMVAEEEEQQHHRLAEAEQFVQYARAQRLYATLLDRYNPGMNMSEEERHRLTVRRVGMNMPQEWKAGEDGKQ